MPAPALIVVDVQKAFADPVLGPARQPGLRAQRRRPDRALARGGPAGRLRPPRLRRAGLAAAARAAGQRVPGHRDRRARPAGHQVGQLVLPGKPDLQAWLDGGGRRDHLHLRHHHRPLLRDDRAGGRHLGYDVRFVLDATHTFDRPDPERRDRPRRADPRVSATSLHGEFATVIDTATALAVDRALVNFFYAQPVGHAVEALYYANGHRVANPEWEIHVAMNAATPVELASFCTWVSAAYPIAHPFLEAASEESALDGVPRELDWIVDDGRRHQPIQAELFPGMAGYYAASDRCCARRRGGGRSVIPAGVRARTNRSASSCPARGGRPLFAALTRSSRPCLPARANERSTRPSRSWRLILDALAEALPGARFALIGRLAHDQRTTTSFGRDPDALLAHPQSRSTRSTCRSPSSSRSSSEARSSSRHTPGSGSPRSRSARRGSRCRAAAGSSTSSTMSRSARSSRTSSATRRSPSSSRRRWTATARRA